MPPSCGISAHRRTSSQPRMPVCRRGNQAVTVADRAGQDRRMIKVIRHGEQFGSSRTRASTRRSGGWCQSGRHVLRAAHERPSRCAGMPALTRSADPGRGWRGVRLSGSADVELPQRHGHDQAIRHALPRPCGRRAAAAADGDASPAVQYRATYAVLIRFTHMAVSFSACPGWGAGPLRCVQLRGAVPAGTGRGFLEGQSA